MTDYRSILFAAKHQATRTLCEMNDKDRPATTDHMAAALDALNQAWGALTDCLVRQREERDTLITHLLAELAEARNGQ